MYSETKKLHLIEELIHIENEETLQEIEFLIKKSSQKANKKKISASDFLGLISEEDSNLINKAIEKGCEQINSDDWK